MNKKISTRDWQALSTYLDGQLAPKQRKRMEARLKQEPALQDALDGLRHTRAIIRNQPKLRAPRNFALTPQMAGLYARQRRQSVYPVLRLASVLAMIFFVILFASDFYLSNFGPEPLMVSQNATLQKSDPWFGVGGAGGGSDAPEEVFEQPLEEPAAALERSVEPEAEGKMIQPSLEDAAAGEPEATSAEMRDEESVYPAAPEQPVTLTQRAVIEGWSLLRILQILLAILAVGAGLAAFLSRRKHRQ